MANSALIDALKDILLSGNAGTQEEIVHSLEAQGFEVNQSKVSRVLRKLGAVKITNERKEIIYALPLEPAPPTSKNILSQLISNISYNEAIVVIHTNPGSASLIARLLDHHRQELKILGTVAGDDTLFITPLSLKNIKQTVLAIREFIAELSD